MSHEQNRIALTCRLVVSVVLLSSCHENQPAAKTTHHTANHASPQAQFGIEDTLRAAKRFAVLGDKEKVRQLSRQILLQAPGSPRTNWEVFTILRGLNLHSDATDVIEQLPVDAIIEMNHVPESFDSFLKSKRYDQA